MKDNTLISPYADERKNDARITICSPTGEELVDYTSKKILEVSLIREFQTYQSVIPRSEITFKVDNQDGKIDLTNAENVVYKLERKAYCDSLFSSVEYGTEANYVKKGRYFYDSLSNSDSTVTFKFVDAVSQYEFINTPSSYAFNKIGLSEISLVQFLEGVALQTKYSLGYYLPDDMKNAFYFTKQSFFDGETPIYIKEALYNISKILTSKLKTPVYFIIDEDGTMTCQKKKTEVSSIISEKHYFNCEIVQLEGTLICKVSDRGNILFELGDVIQVSKDGKIFKTEIYKLQYTLKMGHLSCEWEGVVLQ